MQILMSTSLSYSGPLFHPRLSERWLICSVLIASNSPLFSSLGKLLLTSPDLASHLCLPDSWFLL